MRIIYYLVPSIYKPRERISKLCARFRKSREQISKLRERNSNHVHVLVHRGNELVNRSHKLFIFSCMSYAGLHTYQIKLEEKQNNNNIVKPARFEVQNENF